MLPDFLLHIFRIENVCVCVVICAANTRPDQWVNQHGIHRHGRGVDHFHAFRPTVLLHSLSPFL